MFSDNRGNHLEIRHLNAGIAIGCTNSNDKDISCILTPAEMRKLAKVLMCVAEMTEGDAIDEMTAA
jgi:hypothetical protein